MSMNKRVMKYPEGGEHDVYTLQDLTPCLGRTPKLGPVFTNYAFRYCERYRFLDFLVLLLAKLYSFGQEPYELYV